MCISFSGDTPALYQVLPEKLAAVGGAMMGSAHVYDMSAVSGPLYYRYTIHHQLTLLSVFSAVLTAGCAWHDTEKSEPVTLYILTMQMHMHTYKHT